jgi:hypothetical protein
MMIESNVLQRAMALPGRRPLLLFSPEKSFRQRNTGASQEILLESGFVEN